MGISSTLNYKTAPDTLGGMITAYINGALKRARFEKIEDRNPYYGEIPGLKGVWATGKTLAECRRNLSEALDGWIIVRLRKSLPMPKINGIALKAATRLAVNV
jgi:predicted RNase H-like HicB family nuclease